MIKQDVRFPHAGRRFTLFGIAYLKQSIFTNVIRYIFFVSNMYIFPEQETIIKVHKKSFKLNCLFFQRNFEDFFCI